ncbi:MAG: reverse gyrase [Candidatus Bathyarchaeia archaeon]
MVVALRGIYHGLCVNCRGAVSDERLLHFGICENCLESVENIRSWKQALKALEERGKLYFAGEVFDFYRKFGEFSKFFKRAVGQRMWSLQEAWARRILLKRNFSIVAPTGVGKTVLGTVAALYFAFNGKKSYIIVPTALLVQQVAEKIDTFSERLGIHPRKVCYHAALGEEEKRGSLERLVNGDFDILVTTERFLISHFKVLKGKNFDFVFVDDVDSFLKSPRNIDRVLAILGFDDAIIKLAFQLINLRREASRLRRMGKSPSEVLQQIESMRNKIEDYKSRNNIGLLVVSGATVKAKRTRRIKLFEELLKFQIGFKPEFLRNIKDFYLEASGDVESQVLSLIKSFGSGCLIFVPSVFGRSRALKLSDFLNANGVKAHAYVKMDEEILEKFEKGEYDALIGVASFRSPLARGIDLPERVRYVIFAGVPRMEIKLSWEECNPTKILTLLKNIREFLGKNQQDKASQIINNLRRITPTDKQTLEKIKASIEAGVPLSGYEDYVKRLVLDARGFLKSAITPEVIERIMQSKEVSLKKRDGEFYLIVADPVAYVQASGRASRMFAGGITRGASLLLVDDEKAFYSLRRKLEFMLGEATWTRFNAKTAEKWFKKVDEDRTIIREIREGRIVKRIKDFIKAALLIVESPTKARTISRFFGKPYKRKIGNITVFEVSTGEFVLNIVASMGHIYDLVINEGFHGVKIQNGNFIPIYDFIKMCKKCGEQFTGFEFCPKCKSQEFYSKSELIDAMRSIALEVNSVLIATDPDIEGEKIAYDVYCSLYPVNNKVERLEFHEITKKAFLQAVKNRREINLRMVEAQLVRRIEDRWIGFELSQKLWRRFQNYRLSAGRVQTPVLGWIIERVSESRKKKKILSAVLSNGLKVSIENPILKFPAEQLEKRISELKARIIDLKTEERSINPPPPYTTDALLRDASVKLGFSATKTMMTAQDLFEMGLCTYHRTDSTTVSATGIGIAKDYIQEKYPSLFVPRRYFMEGAHECVRPTRPLDVEQLKNLISMGILRFPKRLTSDHFQLYDLIFKRFIASQMREAKLLYQQFKVLIDGNQTFVENPVSILSDGFNAILPIKTVNAVQEGEYALMLAKLLYLPAARPFTQGEIIALMKERGVGRPSTYAKTVATILERHYAIERGNRLISTTLGFKVYKYLNSTFGEYTSEEATRKLESIMDMIEQGKADYKEILKELYEEILEIRKV